MVGNLLFIAKKQYFCPLFQYNLMMRCNFQKPLTF